MNNLPKVVAQQRCGRASNPRLLDRKFYAQLATAPPLNLVVIYGNGIVSSTYKICCQVFMFRLCSIKFEDNGDGMLG